MKKSIAFLISGAILAMAGSFAAYNLKKKARQKSAEDIELSPEELEEIALEAEGEAMPPMSLAENAPNKRDVLKIQGAGREVRFNTDGMTCYYEDGRLVSTSPAKWWPKGRYCICVMQAYRSNNRWLFFFGIDDGESFFCDFSKLFLKGGRYMYPDYVMALNRRLEVIPVCSEGGRLVESHKAMCKAYGEKSQSLEYGKKVFVEITEAINRPGPDAVRIACIDPKTKEFVVCDTQNFTSVSRNNIINRLVGESNFDECMEKCCYVGDILLFNLGDAYGYMELGTPNSSNGATKYIDTDVFRREHDFARFVSACHEVGKDIKSSPFYEILPIK